VIRLREPQPICLTKRRPDRSTPRSSICRLLEKRNGFVVDQRDMGQFF
jgi:hypothetical protein